MQSQIVAIKEVFSFLFCPLLFKSFFLSFPVADTKYCDNHRCGKGNYPHQYISTRIFIQQHGAIQSQHRAAFTACNHSNRPYEGKRQHYTQNGKSTEQPLLLFEAQFFCPQLYSLNPFHRVIHSPHPSSGSKAPLYIEKKNGVQVFSYVLL